MFKFLQAEEETKHGISPFRCLFLCIKKYHNFGQLFVRKYLLKRIFSLFRRALYSQSKVFGKIGNQWLLTGCKNKPSRSQANNQWDFVFLHLSWSNTECLSLFPSCETLSYKLTKSVPLLSLIHKTELAHPNCRQGGVPGFCKVLSMPRVNLGEKIFSLGQKPVGIIQTF